jgi:hypothetical protein
MQDELGIVYLIDTAQQFWSGMLLLLILLGPYSNHAVELEDILDLPDDEAPTLSLLDATLRRSLVLCATYHGTCQRFHLIEEALNCLYSTEQYLQSPLQLEHACNMLLDSELFAFHSERMCEIIADDTQTVRLP